MEIAHGWKWPAGNGWRWRSLQAFGNSNWKVKAKFLAQSFLKGDALMPILRGTPGSSLHRYVQERPDTTGFLIWPYQCASWEPEQRVRRIAEHFAILDRIGAPFPFSVDEKLLLWDLDQYSPGVRIILDQPSWLFREGLLALNIFCGDFRAYSVAFSLFGQPEAAGIFIGGMQGRSTEGALETYKVLTKDFHGMRPRDLLLDCLKLLAPALQARHILAVADEHRHLRHPYFGNDQNDHADYDAMWQERGGVRADRCFWELPMELSLRPLDDVPSRKRAQYRRRNEMLENLQLGNELLPSSRLLRFDAT